MKHASGWGWGYGWAFAALVIGLALSGAAARMQAGLNESRAQTALENAAEAATDRLRRRMQTYEYGLRGARGAVLTAGPQQITREAFARYSASRDVQTEFPATLGFGFIRRVAPQDEAAFIARARADGFPAFSIRQLTTFGGERFVIQYIEPQAPNVAAVGLDIASEPTRREAALSAMRTGQATATGPITLVQGHSAPQRGVLLMLPVYSSATVPPPAERASSLVGWTYTPLSLDAVLADIDQGTAGISMQMTDMSVLAKTDPADARAAVAPSGAPLRHDQTLEMFGRQWRLAYAADATFVDGLHQLQPSWVFLGGTFTSLAAAGLLLLLLAMRDKSRQVAAQRARLASVVESSSDAMIGQAPDGTVVFWNGAAARLFGYSAEEAVGRPVAELLLPGGRAGEDAALIRAAMSGQPVSAYQSVRWDREGRPIDVSISAGPIRGLAGETIGVAKVLHDIRDRVSLQKQLEAFNQRLEQQVQARTEELAVAHRDLRTVMDSLPSMIGYWDRDLRHRVANRAYAARLGGPPDRLRGRPMAELLGPEEFEQIRPFVQATLRGAAQAFERTQTGKPGEGDRHELAQFVPDRVDGEVRGFYVIVHDVTELEESRRALAREREHLAHVIDGTMAGTWAWNEASGECRINERWAGMLGHAPGHWQPMNIQAWRSLIHPEDLPAWEAALASHLEGRAPVFESVARLHHREGHWVWVQARGRRFGRGADSWMYGTHLDVTAARLTQLQLEQVSTLLQNVLRAATELSIIATDTEGRITIFNAGAERMLGYAAKDMVGCATPGMVHVPEEVKARGTELSARLGRPVRGIEIYTLDADRLGSDTREWTYVRRDGSRLPVSLTITPIRDAGGVVLGYLGIAQDVSAQRQAKQVQQEARQAAERASEAKGRFLANMSHEIRTPLNAVIGIGELLIDGQLSPDQLLLVRKLQLAGRSLLGVVNDVLDLARIESGELELERVVFDPRTLMSEVAELFQVQASAKGLRLTYEGQDMLPALVAGDAQRLRQVLINLMSNAVKFTDRGRIVLQASPGEGAAAEGRVRARWTVRDTGCGIEPEALEKLFQPFVQADTSTTRRYGGSGLGLSIVRELAQRMGGEAGAQSQPGQGSAFWVELPLEPVEAAQAGHHRLDVVVVDDQPADLGLLCEQCRAFGWQATPAPSGEALLALMQQRVQQGGALPDVLLVDWQLPGIDGLQALAQMATELGQRRPAALVISAHERAAMEAANFRAHVDRVMIKPVNPSELFNAVNHAIATHTGSTTHVLQLTRLDTLKSQWLAGLNILVVDDSDINREVCGRLLQREGAQVAAAQDGVEAVELLQRDPTRFDAVLMDVQMPRLDGYGATRQIRQELGLSTLPILALTAGALAEEKRLAADAGMNGFLTKPLDAASLIRTLRALVEEARKAPLPIAAPGAAMAEPSAWPSIEGIDAAAASLQAGGDAPFFLGLLRRLLAENPASHLLALDAGAVANQRAALAGHMHRLRGSAAMLGAQALQALAGEAEDAFHAGETPDALLSRLQAVAAELQRLKESAGEPLAQEQDRQAAEQAEQVARAEPLADVDLLALAEMLRSQDLAAVAWVGAHAASLRVTLGDAAFADLRAAVERLDFPMALLSLPGRWDTARE